MAIVEQPLRFYTQPSDHPPLEWAFVEQQLRDAGTYWVVAATDGHPHPRPVWGVWHGERLHLSIGTPSLRAAIGDGRKLTVHLDSGVDVVIVEGAATGATADRSILDVYDAKYDWTYDADSYGSLVTITPRTVLAWRSAGPAGRDGFRAASRWDVVG